MNFSIMDILSNGENKLILCDKYTLKLYAPSIKTFDNLRLIVNCQDSEVDE
jgi:hypothetical protein